MTFNRERAIDYMSRCNLDVLVATSSTIITYFSGSACWLDSKFKQYMMMPGASDYLMPTTTFVVFPLKVLLHWSLMPCFQLIPSILGLTIYILWEISPQVTCLHQIFNLIPNEFF